MIEVRKKKGESFESLVRRFNKRVQQSGRLYEARAIRFFSQRVTKNKQHRDAVRRSEIRDNKEYLRKIGKLNDDVFETKKFRQ